MQFMLCCVVIDCICPLYQSTSVNVNYGVDHIRFEFDMQSASASEDVETERVRERTEMRASTPSHPSIH